MTSSYDTSLAAKSRRKEAYFSTVCSMIPRWFAADGGLLPSSETDPRIPFWIVPALLSDPASRATGTAIYTASPAWPKWDVFVTSSIAANLVRHGAWLSEELRRRSEDHLARFCVVDGGEGPCSAAIDYVFHGYNDNMPALAARALILGGDVTGSRDFIDRGRFRLETLCAHFRRRGFLSEHTSGTYTPITIAALMDIADLAQDTDCREMALACAERCLLDLCMHFHLGGLCGAQSRAHVSDEAHSLSNDNALLWYLTGHPLCIDPAAEVKNPEFSLAIHHESNRLFIGAQFVELMASDFAAVNPDILAHVVEDFGDSREIVGTSDGGQMAPAGCVEIVVRAWHRPSWGLGTRSTNWFDRSGQTLALHGIAAAKFPMESWRDRISFWHHLRRATLDPGMRELDRAGSGSAEIDCVLDQGHYHTVQKGGSALVVGSLPEALEKEAPVPLVFAFVFQTQLMRPDEEAQAGEWRFLRFGEVFIGLRMVGMVDGSAREVRRVDRNGYLRFEIELLDGETPVTRPLREWTDFGYVLEIDDSASGSFADFQRECEVTKWEWFNFYNRQIRYEGRQGVLELCDSPATHTLRFTAINGKVEPRPELRLNGVDLPQLPIPAHGVAFDLQQIRSPFTQHPAQVPVG